MIFTKSIPNRLRDPLIAKPYIIAEAKTTEGSIFSKTFIAAASLIPIPPILIGNTPSIVTKLNLLIVIFCIMSEIEFNLREFKTTSNDVWNNLKAINQ